MGLRPYLRCNNFQPRMAEMRSLADIAAMAGHRPLPVQERTCCSYPGMSEIDLGCVKTLRAEVIRIV
jgi:hypothetical protein